MIYVYMVRQSVKRINEINDLDIKMTLILKLTKHTCTLIIINLFL